MTKITNQDIEKYYFEMFRQVYRIPQGLVCYGDRPDVIIKGKERIGIEITNFYREEGNLLESEQAQGNFRKKIVFRAQKIYQNDGGRNINISFGFDKNNPIRDTKLRSNLVDLAKRIENQPEGEISRDMFKTIPELDFVHLSKEVQGLKWQVCQVYRGSKMLRKRLLEIVCGKEKKVSGYQKCDAYWLLVVIDFFDRAQDQEILFDGFDKIETDIFEKVIVYRTGVEKAFEY